MENGDREQCVFAHSGRRREQSPHRSIIRGQPRVKIAPGAQHNYLICIHAAWRMPPSASHGHGFNRLYSSGATPTSRARVGQCRRTVAMHVEPSHVYAVSQPGKLGLREFGRQLMRSSTFVACDQPEVCGSTTCRAFSTVCRSRNILRVLAVASAPSMSTNPYFEYHETRCGYASTIKYLHPA
jgi:hypothetical protein